MTHGRSIVPGRHLVSVDYRGDTNLFAVQVTDSTIALSTIRSTFVTADERIRWRVPPGTVRLECYGYESPFCKDVNAWLARRPGIERVQFRGPAALYADTLSAPAYGYANEQALATVRSCFRSISPELALGVELQIRPLTGPSSSVRAVRRNGAVSTTWIDPACGFPPSIYGFGKSLTSYYLTCPVASRFTCVLAEHPAYAFRGAPSAGDQRGARLPAGPFKNIGPTLPPSTITVMEATAKPGVWYRYRLEGTGTGRARGETGYSNEAGVGGPRPVMIR